MSIFSRKPNLDTPSGVVAHFLKTDNNPTVTFFRDHREALTREVELSWVGLTREQRLHDLRGCHRFFLIFVVSEDSFEDLSPEFQGLIALAGAKSRVLGFMWEQTYGESMQHLAASWVPLSEDELKEYLSEENDGSDFGPFERAALESVEAVHSMPDDVVQPADKVVLSASLRAGARVAESLAAMDLAEWEGDEDSVPELLAYLRQAERDRNTAVLHRTVAAIGWYFVLFFIHPYQEDIGEDGPEWARQKGWAMSPYDGEELAEDWLAETYLRRAGKGSGDFHTRWAIGVLTALGCSEDDAYGGGMYAAMLLPSACLEQLESWKTELRGAGLIE